MLRLWLLPAGSGEMRDCYSFISAFFRPAGWLATYPPLCDIYCFAPDRVLVRRDIALHSTGSQQRTR